MPKLFVHSREGTFSADARAEVAAALTDLGIACEKLADTPKVRRGVWVFFTEHAGDAVFSGGQEAIEPLMALVVYALEGGLDAEAKVRLIAGATDILGRHATTGADPTPAYVVIREVPESAWGMYGRTVGLAALRTGG